MSEPVRLRLWTPDDRTRAQRMIAAAPKGWRVELKPPVRSINQNARLWACLDDVAAQAEWEGHKRSAEAWKELFTACLRQQEIVRGLEGGIVALGARTSEMAPAEMSDLLELIIAWGTQNGVQFSDQGSSAHADEERPAVADGNNAGAAGREISGASN
jgi:hypothetical protein